MRLNTNKIIIMLICTAACSTPSFAQTRTTPVEVKNTPAVKIDQTGNTVKVDPSGNSVKIDPTANAVQINGTPNVNVTNTPTVNVGNTPVVKVDPAQNTVKTPTQSTIVSFTTPGQTIAPNGVVTSPLINCAGYREMRIVSMLTSPSSASSNVKINVRFRAPASGGYALVGTGSFATPSTQLTSYANFVQSDSIAIMIIPIISDYAYIEIVNKQTYTIGISDSWVYLLN